MQNVSAVLDKHGLPWIDGYKPLSAFQREYFPDRVLQEAETRRVVDLDLATKPTDDRRELERRAGILGGRSMSEPPSGNPTPRVGPKNPDRMGTIGGPPVVEG